MIWAPNLNYTGGHGIIILSPSYCASLYLFAYYTREGEHSTNEIRLDQCLSNSLVIPRPHVAARNRKNVQVILEFVLADTFGCGKLQKRSNPSWYQARHLPARIWKRLLFATVQVDDFPMFLLIWYTSNFFRAPPATLWNALMTVPNIFGFHQESATEILRISTTAPYHVSANFS